MEVVAGLADDQGLAHPFVIRLGLAEHILGEEIGQPLVHLAVQLGLAVLFFLQKLAVGVASGHLAEPFYDAAPFFGDFG